MEYGYSTSLQQINRWKIHNDRMKNTMSRLLESLPIVRKKNCFIKYYDDLEESAESFYKKMDRFQFQTSYGLIVKTDCGKVVMIERKFPYCVQTFMIKKQKESTNPFSPFDFTDPLKEEFEKEFLPALKESDRLDYRRYLALSDCEDKFDFPHGQMDYKFRKKIYAKPYERRRILFRIAYREFVEETGYRFSYDVNDIDHFPMCEVQFDGLDGRQYTQYYFIIENVQNLKRISFFECFSNDERLKYHMQLLMERMFYKARVLDVKSAIKHLRRQQRLKVDFKHLLLIDPKDWIKLKFKTN